MHLLYKLNVDFTYLYWVLRFVCSSNLFCKTLTSTFQYCMKQLIVLIRVNWFCQSCANTNLRSGFHGCKKMILQLTSNINSLGGGSFFNWVYSINNWTAARNYIFQLKWCSTFHCRMQLISRVLSSQNTWNIIYCNIITNI